MKGCFIVFEGIDGSGKTEQLNRLEKNLRKENYDVIHTIEPTKTLMIGSLIRNILYKKIEVTEEALALLFAADRAEHTKKKIIPALQTGAIVLSDRYVYSSLAYQSKGMRKELNFEWIKKINQYAISPNLVIFLDIPPKVGLERLKNGQIRIQDHTFFEDLIRQEKIRSAYYNIFNLNNNPNLWDFLTDIKKIKINKYMEMKRLKNTLILRIDGTLSKDDIEKRILTFVRQYLTDLNVLKIQGNKPQIQKLHIFNNNNISESKP